MSRFTTPVCTLFFSFLLLISSNVFAVNQLFNYLGKGSNPTLRLELSANAPGWKTYSIGYQSVGNVPWSAELTKGWSTWNVLDEKNNHYGTITLKSNGVTVGFDAYIGGEGRYLEGIHFLPVTGTASYQISVDKIHNDIFTIDPILGSAVDYLKIQQNVQTVVSKFNLERRDGLTLIPNVIPMNQDKLDKAVREEPWSLQFGYDASRHPLFNGAYCLAKPDSMVCKEAKSILAGLLTTIKIIPEINLNFTLPTSGIWAYNVGTNLAGRPVDGSSYPAESGGSPALDGPVAVAERAVHGRSAFYEGLIGTLNNYDLSRRTPALGGKEADFLASTSPYFNGSLALLSQALLVGDGDLEKTRSMPISASDRFDTKSGFIKNYQAWVNVDYGFLAPFEVTDKAKKLPGLRVIFSVKNAPHTADDNWPNAGNSPTASEGMAYGLLIAYAANDQDRFDKLLNFILFEAYNHGCARMNQDLTACNLKTDYLMPWLVDQTGKPFHYTIGGGFLTDGSATDADINIVWALKLAESAVKSGDWQPYAHFGMDYATLAKKMQVEIARYDMNKDVKFFAPIIGELYSPGSQWNGAGKNVVYPGYDAPQAFEALSKSK